MSMDPAIKAAMLAQPLHQQMGLTDIDAADGHSQFEITVTDATVNLSGYLHGGVVYTLCDVAGFSALFSKIGPGLTAATHDLHVSVMKAAKRGDTLRFTGELLRMGRSIAVMRSDVWRGDERIATATVTKSLLPAG